MRVILFFYHSGRSNFFLYSWVSTYVKKIRVFELNVLDRTEWVSWDWRVRKVVERGDRALFANLWIHDGLDMWQAWVCENKYKMLRENLKIIEFCVTRAYDMELLNTNK
jgi:hypothetical protein